MGLLSSIFSSPKTKAEWDRKIISLNNQLASAKTILAQAKANKKRIKGMNYDGTIHQYTYRVEQLKAEIANAKIERRNAPDEDTVSSSSSPSVSRRRSTSGSERNAKEAASNSANRRAITPVSINNSADVEDNEEERAEKRKKAEEREKQKQVIKDIRSAILLYVEEKTELSRAEMREELLEKYNCSLSTYVETEKSVLEPLYASLLNRKVLGDKTVNDGILDTLARLLEKDNE